MTNNIRAERGNTQIPKKKKKNSKEECGSETLSMG